MEHDQHEWVPGDAPYYRCRCGAWGKRVRGAVVRVQAPNNWRESYVNRVIDERTDTERWWVRRSIDGDVDEEVPVPYQRDEDAGEEA